ncbi:hypothetical protein [uncultured Lactobacillus sp.]|uniref:hypothetical protein n=1 Tax=uncultured Lactobacillus sp. TaxID=153152 RepID=UPI00260D2DDE|nr:hypothetical protein [uncultured Lactobacillus sp.]
MDVSKIETTTKPQKKRSFNQALDQTRESFECHADELIDILESDYLTETGKAELRTLIPTLLNISYDRNNTFWKKANKEEKQQNV